MAVPVRGAPLLFFLLLIINFLIFSSLAMPILAGGSGDDYDGEYSYVTRVDPKKMGMTKRQEKLSHFRLYWHDNISGPHPTSIPVVRPPINSTTFFGAINMIDNPLTVGPEMSSKLVGRAQGFYSSASLEEAALLMVMNFAFSDGKYNGSTFTVLGRNTVFSETKEMSVIGGSGLFRFARGYVQLHSYSLDLANRNAVVEYNAFVFHY